MTRAAGCTPLRITWVFGEGLSIFGGLIRLFAWMFILAGFLIQYFAVTVGLGSVLLHRFSPLPASAK